MPIHYLAIQTHLSYDMYDADMFTASRLPVTGQLLDDVERGGVDILVVTYSACFRYSGCSHLQATPAPTLPPTLDTNRAYPRRYVVLNLFWHRKLGIPGDRSFAEPRGRRSFTK